MKKFYFCLLYSFCFITFYSYGQNVSLVNPSSAQQSQSLSITISGNNTHFASASNTNVYFTQGTSTIWSDYVDVYSNTSLEAYFSFSSGNPTGLYNVTVFDKTDGTLTLNNGFSLLLAPQIKTITPNTANQGNSLTVTISGSNTNFGQGTSTTSIWFEQGSSTIYPQSINIVNKTQATAIFKIPQTASVGDYDVLTNNSIDGDVIFPNGFYISPANPDTSKIEQIVPDNGQLNEYLDVTISGQSTHFKQGTGTLSVWFNQGTSTIYAYNISTVTDIQLIASFELSGNIPTGNYDVNIYDSVDGYLIKNKGFRIDSVSSSSILTANISPSQAAICSGSGTILTASATGGSGTYVYSWSNGLGTGSIKTVNPTSTTTYIVTVTGGTNNSNTAQSVITVNSLPTAPICSDMSISSRNTATLNASGGSTYEWYDAANGGNLLYTGASFTTPALTQTTTYYVANYNDICESPRTAVNVIVTGVVPCSGYIDLLTGGTFASAADDSSNISPVNIVNSQFSVTYTLDAQILNYWPWVMVECKPATKSFIGLCSVSLTYKTDHDVQLVLFDPTIVSGASYMYLLPISASAWNTVTIPISQFAQPSWASPTSPLNLSFVNMIQFVPIDYGTTGTITVNELKLYGLDSLSSALTATISPSETVICSGSFTTLSAGATGGIGSYTYSWSNGLGTNSIKTVNPASTTTYSVTVTDGANNSNTAQSVVTVNPLPVTPVIIQNQDTLVSNASAGNQWYMNTGSILNETNDFYIPITSDDYYVITTINGCSSNKSNVIRVILELDKEDTLFAPIDNTQKINDSIFLSVKDSCLFDYTLPIDTFYIESVVINNSQMLFSWVFKQGNNTYNIVSDADINKLSSGYDLIYLTIQCNEVKKKGLHTNTFAEAYNITSVSVGNIKQSLVNVTFFPNPTSDKFTIVMENLKESYNLEIFNAIGQSILNKQITNLLEQVDLSSQAAGIYFVKLQTADNTFVKKIIKQ